MKYLRCAFCIGEALKEYGSWDRFGTTHEQELEAMCDKHLLKLHDQLLRFDEDVSKLKVEIERRKLGSLTQ